jgi:hypothetical protein
VSDDHAVGRQGRLRRQFPLRFWSCGRLVHAEGVLQGPNVSTSIQQNINYG